MGLWGLVGEGETKNNDTESQRFNRGKPNWMEKAFPSTAAFRKTVSEKPKV